MYGWRYSEHEIGHYLNLYHTHDQVNAKELVNGSNCSVAGDLLCDTPADPNVYQEVNSGCVYIGSATDPNGQSYNPPLTNIMSYAPHSCRNQFTAQQWAKMLLYYENYAKQILSCTPKPDFTIALSGISFFTSGQQQNLALEISNFSPVAYNGDLRITLYLKSPGGVTTILYDALVNQNWAVYSNSTINISPLIPSSLSNGAYELIAEVNPDKSVDESAGNTNIAKTNIGVYEQNAQLCDISLQVSAPANYIIGQNYNFSYSISNVGTVETSSGPSLEYFISNDPYLSKDDQYFGPFWWTNLTPGTTQTGDDYVTFSYGNLDSILSDCIFRPFSERK